MNRYEELCEILEHELMEITKDGNISAGNLEAVHKLTDTIKNIKKIEMYSDESDSYASRQGMHYVKGHYSRNNKRMMDDGRYSYSDGMDHIIYQMEEMIDNPSISDTEKNMIKKAMNMLQH